MDIAISMAVQQDIPVLYLDTEMSIEETYQRLLASVSDHSEHSIMKGKYMLEPEKGMNIAIEGAMDTLRKSPFIYKNIAGKSIEHTIGLIRQFCAHYVKTETIRIPSTGKMFTFPSSCLVVYDWLKIPNQGDLKATSEYQVLGFQASALKDVANRLNIPILAAAQNNRGAIGVTSEEWEEMAESFVAGSDRLSQYATMLCILRNLNQKDIEVMHEHPDEVPMREGMEDKNALRFNQLLHVVLQRAGNEWRSGIPLYLKRGWSRYEELGQLKDFVHKFKGENYSSKKQSPTPPKDPTVAIAAPVVKEHEKSLTSNPLPNIPF